MSAIASLARMLGLSRTAAEESLHSERAARHVLTRRDAFGLAGAMCAGLVVGEVRPPPNPYEAYALLNAIKAETEAANRAFLRQWIRTAGGTIWTAAGSFEADG